jgi:hypothetical protein
VLEQASGGLTYVRRAEKRGYVRLAILRNGESKQSSERCEEAVLAVSMDQGERCGVGGNRMPLVSRIIAKNGASCRKSAEVIVPGGIGVRQVPTDNFEVEN